MVVDVDDCLERLRRCEAITESEVRDVCQKLKELLINEGNVAAVSSPVTVVGDVHGQFYDVLELFRIGGEPPHTNYLFLGDYVDRGHYSVETMSLLACLKVRYPSRVTLLRGNHESRSITQVYGFHAECARKYGSTRVWEYFTDMFDFLAIGALIDGKILGVHGGLSPSIHTLDQIRVLERYQEVPHEGPLADIMWSDPDPEGSGFRQSQRGAGCTFGADVVAKFLRMNNIDHILRAHQLCQEGYQELFNGTLSTVWSAPNYCYRCGNLASILEIDEHLKMVFNTFEAAPASEREVPKPTKDTNDYFL
jgi:serine/threonine-protein phosphatase PPG1